MCLSVSVCVCYTPRSYRKLETVARNKMCVICIQVSLDLSYTLGFRGTRLGISKIRNFVPNSGLIENIVHGTYHASSSAIWTSDIRRPVNDSTWRRQCYLHQPTTVACWLLFAPGIRLCVYSAMVAWAWGSDARSIDVSWFTRDSPWYVGLNIRRIIISVANRSSEGWIEVVPCSSGDVTTGHTYHNMLCTTSGAPVVHNFMSPPKQR